MISRVIGRLASNKPGPLVVLVGALHGNEPAGVRALELLFGQIEASQSLRQGTILGFVGNMAAFRQNRRFLAHDLNRHFTKAKVDDFLNRSTPLLDEDAEVVQLLELLQKEVSSSGVTEVVFLDFHTTTADGGHFITAPTDEASQVLAKALGPPVVFGLTEFLPGTLAGFLTSTRLGIPTRALGYEAGQHSAPKSVERSLELALRLLQYLEMLPDVREAALTEVSDLAIAAHVPALLKVEFRLALSAKSSFIMLPGFRNFDLVQAGDVLGYLDGETIVSDINGYILMPLYQAQGSDGFFLLKPI